MNRSRRERKIDEKIEFNNKKISEELGITYNIHGSLYLLQDIYDYVISKDNLMLKKINRKMENTKKNSIQKLFSKSTENLGSNSLLYLDLSQHSEEIFGELVKLGLQYNIDPDIFLNYRGTIYNLWGDTDASNEYLKKYLPIYNFKFLPIAKEEIRKIYLDVFDPEETFYNRDLQRLISSYTYNLYDHKHGPSSPKMGFRKVGVRSPSKKRSIGKKKSR